MLTRTIARAIVAGTAISLAVMSGCERSDPANAAIKAAAGKLAIAASGPNASPMGEKKEAALKEVLGLIQPYAGSSVPSTSAAANLLIARVQAGLGEIKASNATAMERQASNRLVAMRAFADVWVVQSARAAEAAKYDPAAELAGLDKTAKDIDAKIGEATTAKQRAEAKVAQFEKEADGIAAQSKRKRDEAETLKQQIASGTATQGLATLERAAIIGREADGLDLKISDLRGQAQAAKPAVDAASRDIELLKSRRDSVAKLKETVTSKGQSMKEAAAEARKTADHAASELAASAKAAMDERNEIAGATEATLKAFRDAQASAKKAQQGATGDSKSSAALEAASAQQSIADALAEQARGDEALAVVFKALAATNPALPNKAEIDAGAKTCMDRATKEREEALEAYKAAAEAFQSVNGKDLTERLERIQTMLKALGGGDKKPEAEAAAAPAKADGAAPAGAAPAAAAAADDPAAVENIKKMLADFSKALADGDALKASGFFAARGEEAEKAMESVVMPTLNLIALDGALKGKFKAGLGEILSADPMMGAMMGPALKGMAAGFDFSGGDTEIKASGDKGTMTRPGAPVQNLVKMGDQWLIDVPAQLNAAAGPMAMLLKSFSDTAGELTGDVKADKFKTKEEFLAAFKSKAKMPAMPGMPKPPPGGG